MTNIDVIENKISAIQGYLNILEQYKKYSENDIISDVMLKGGLERYLYLAIQATIELAEAVISYNKFRKVTEYREAFEILHEENAISTDLTERLVKMVGFRNVITHDYTKLDLNILFDALQKRLGDIEEFIEAVKAFCKV